MERYALGCKGEEQGIERCNSTDETLWNLQVITKNQSADKHINNLEIYQSVMAVECNIKKNKARTTATCDFQS